MTQLNESMNDVTAQPEFTDAHVVYAWKCAVCGNDAKTTERLVPGGVFPRAILPAGWKISYDDCGGFICPAHKVVWLVDGEPLLRGEE